MSTRFRTGHDPGRRLHEPSAESRESPWPTSNQRSHQLRMPGVADLRWLAQVLARAMATLGFLIAAGGGILWRLRCDRHREGWRLVGLLHRERGMSMGALHEEVVLVKRFSDPVAFAVAMTVLVLLTILIAVLDFSKADIGWITAGLAGALLASLVFRLVRKG